MDDFEASWVTLRNKMDFTKALAEIPIRVSITGTRGKSSEAYILSDTLSSKGLWTIAKITGDNPFFMDKNGTYNILRKTNHPVFMDETAFLVELCKGAGRWADAVVLENQAIQPYTMYAFHTLYSKPNYIVVTNVRMDHLEFLGKTRSEIAHSYGKSLAVADTVFSGDYLKSVNEILREHAEAIGAKFVVARVPRDRRHIPGAENIYLAQKVLESVTKDFREFGDLRMTSNEVDRYMSTIEGIVNMQPTPFGVDWYDGAKLNDIDSTKMAVNYLFKKNNDRKFALLAYFRADRPARTITFVDYFNNMLDYSQVDRVYLTGTGAEYVQRRIDPLYRHRFKVVPDTHRSASGVVRDISKENVGLITIGNAVTPFMRYLRQMLLVDGQKHAIYHQGARQNPPSMTR